MLQSLLSRLHRSRHSAADAAFAALGGSDWNAPARHACCRFIAQLGLRDATTASLAGRPVVYLSTYDNIRFAGPAEAPHWNCTTARIAELRRCVVRLPETDAIEFTDAHLALLSNLIVRYVTEFSAYPYQAMRTAGLAPGDTFVDIGAFRGYVALKAALAVGNAGRVLAFEPMAENFTFLRAHQELNKLDNLTCVQSVVSNEDAAELPFFAEQNQRNALVQDHLTGDQTQLKVKNTSATALASMAAEAASGRVMCSVTTNGTELQLAKALIDQMAGSRVTTLALTLPIIYTQAKVESFLASLSAYTPAAQMSFPWLKIRVDF